MEHAFFTSYARADATPASRLDRVVDDLRAEVRAVLGQPSLEGICFFDQRSIENGDDWARCIGDAVRMSRVLVCLVSPTFLNSEFCAKEFEVFRRRIDAAGGVDKGLRAVVLVLWDALDLMPGRKLPHVMERYQYSHIELPAAYLEHGLRVLRQGKSHRDSYRRSIGALAKTIGNIAKTQVPLPPLPGPVVFDELARAFENPGTGKFQLAVVVLHDDGPAWVPVKFQPGVAHIIEGVARTMRVGWRELPNDPIRLMAALQRAVDDQAVVVLLTTQGMLQKPRWQQALEVADQHGAANCSLLLGLAEANAGDAAIRAAVPRLSGLQSHHECFVEMAALGGGLARVAERTRMALMAAEGAVAAKVESEGLTASARQEGVPIDTRPALQPPGGVRS